jgi:kynurenine formamidase
LRIGDKFIDEIDTAIRIGEKVVLVLSENSIKSVWVEDEVTTAEERKRGTTVLFPIRLDDAVVETKEAWAAKLRVRHIGDFSQWKNHDDYQRTLQRVLRDLATPK